MSIIIAVAIVLFGLLDLISTVMEFFGHRPLGGSGVKESSLLYRRRMLLHLGLWAVVIVGFWAIVHFGPLRPVHEWIR